MSLKNNNILIITGDLVQYAEIKSAKTPSVEIKSHVKWKPETFQTALKDIHEQNKFREVSILLSDALTYVLNMEVEYDSTDDGDLRATIADHLQGVIPEKIEDIVWDYQVINKTEKRFHIEVAAMKKSVHSAIHAVFSKENVKIRHIEPFSTSIARIMKADDFTVIIYLSNVESIITLVRKGFVYFSTSISDVEDSDYVVKILKYLKTEFSLSEKTICILSGISNLIKKNEIDMFVVKKMIIEIAPYMGILKFDLKEKNEVNLDLEVVHNTVDDDKTFFQQIVGITRNSSANKKKSKGKSDGLKNKTNLYVMIGVLLLMLIVAIIVVASYLKKNTESDSLGANTTGDIEQIANQDTNTNANDNMNAESTQSADIQGPKKNNDEILGMVVKEDEADLYKVRVIDGTGKEVDAVKVRDKLSALNISVDDIDVKHAFSFDHKDIVISHKSSVSDEVIDQIEDELSSYAVVIGKELGVVYPFDIEITVGIVE